MFYFDIFIYTVYSILIVNYVYEMIKILTKIIIEAYKNTMEDISEGDSNK